MKLKNIKTIIDTNPNIFQLLKIDVNYNKDSHIELIEMNDELGIYSVIEIITLNQYKKLIKDRFLSVKKIDSKLYTKSFIKFILE
jgi:hypothetical protein